MLQDPELSHIQSPTPPTPTMPARHLWQLGGHGGHGDLHRGQVGCSLGPPLDEILSQDDTPRNHFRQAAVLELKSSNFAFKDSIGCVALAISTGQACLHLSELLEVLPPDLVEAAVKGLRRVKKKLPRPCEENSLGPVFVSSLSEISQTWVIQCAASQK